MPIRPYTTYLLIICFAVSFSARGQVKNGEFKSLYPNGTTKETGTYRKKLKHGVWTMYFESGRTHLKTTYSEGLREGPELEYDNSGLLRYARWYHNDSLHGLYYVYDAQQHPVSINEYRNGKKNGWALIYWTGYGLYLREKKYYRNDTVVVNFNYHNNGRIESVTPYNKGVIHGTVRRYPYRYYTRRDTFPTITTEYIEGQIQGLRLEYDYSGNLVRKEHYVNGKWDGLAQNFRSDGRLFKEENYKNGTAHGTTTYYEYIDTSISKTSVSVFNNGVRDGKQYVLFRKDTLQLSWYANGLMDSMLTYGISGDKFYVKEKTVVKERTVSASTYSVVTYFPDAKVQFRFDSWSPTSVDFGYPIGLMTEFYPDGFKKVQGWYGREQRPPHYGRGYTVLDSFYRSWYPGGRPESSCRISKGILSARPDIWSEKGVKLVPSSVEYGEKFRSLTPQIFSIDRKVYDPTTDQINWDEASFDTEDVAVIGVEDEGYNYQPDQDVVYTDVDVVARPGDNPEAINDWVLYHLSPEVYWFNIPVEDSVRMNFKISNRGRPEEILEVNKTEKSEYMSQAVLKAIRETSEWLPAIKEGRSVRSAQSFTLQMRELAAVASGGTFVPEKSRRR